MIIQTLEKKYIVIQHEETNIKMERYICNDVKENRKCLIICIKDKLLITSIIDFFIEQLKNKRFTDFYDCFINGEFFYLVFAYPEGKTIEEKLNIQECSLKERLMLFQYLLEKIIVFQIPLYLQYDCLSISTIFVSDNMNISFLFHLTNLEQFQEVTFYDVKKQLCSIFEFIFQLELKYKTIPILTQFYQSICQEYDTYLEIYKVFAAAANKIVKLEKEEIERPKTKLFLWWEQIKMYIPPFKKMVSIALFITVIIYFIIIVKQTREVGATKQVFKHIGTLEIE